MKDEKSDKFGLQSLAKRLPLFLTHQKTKSRLMKRYQGLMPKNKP